MTEVWSDGYLLFQWSHGPMGWWREHRVEDRMNPASGLEGAGREALQIMTHPRTISK
jgi:hypothetical protein